MKKSSVSKKDFVAKASKVAKDLPKVAKDLPKAANVLPKVAKDLPEITVSATEQVSEGSDNTHSDPKKCFSQVWIFLHLRAEYADATGAREEYISLLHWLASIFWCPDCAEHFRKYLKDYPPEDKFYMGEYMRLFHNAVNTRLGKQNMDKETYDEIYKKGGLLKICDNCTVKNVDAVTGVVSAAGSQSLPIGSTVPNVLKPFNEDILFFKGGK